MKHIRYIFLLLVMLCGVTIQAQDFNPDNPPEPMARYRLTVKANPSEAANVRGGGKYKMNEHVYISTQDNSIEWKFINWTKSDGTVVNSSTSFYYYTTNRSETLTANYKKVATSKISLSSTPGNKANLYGAGTYKTGSKVTIQCSPYSYFQFLYWTTPDGVKVSDKYSFSYTTTEEDVQFVAHLKFNPNSPGEPSETKNKHKVFFKTIPAGTGYFSHNNGTQVAEGGSINLVAYNYSDWKFKYWEKDGVIVSETNTYPVEMGTEDIHLVARFAFDPGNPGEPNESNKSAYTLYGVQSDIYKGQILMYPIYFENTGIVTSLNFKVKVPNGFIIDTAKAKLSDSRASAYKMEAAVDTTDESGTVYAVNIAGGTEISGNNGILLYLPISVAQEVLPKSYSILFVEGQAMTSETPQTLSFRHGVIKVSSLDESGLRAQFMVDTYLNRVQFTNNSSKEAQSFVWDFGDRQQSTERSPMHIYPRTGGTYNVKLTARGIVAEKVAEQAININSSAVWSASGDYTINPETKGVRNFISMKEAIEILSDCKMNGNSSFTLSSGKEYALNLNEPALFDKFIKIADNLKDTGYSMRFVAPEGEKSTIAITLPEQADKMQSILDWCRLLQLDNVNLQLNGVKVDLTILNKPAQQTICTDMPTSVVPFSSIATDARLSIHWKAIAKENCQLSGYTTAGEGNIPTMTIHHAGNQMEYVTYEVLIKLEGRVIYDYTYTINVTPSIQNSNLSYYSPSNKSELSSLSQNLDWNDVSGAIGYRLEVKRLENGAVVENVQAVELEKDQSSYRINNLKGGAEYTWQVFAIGKCDEKAGEIWTFTTMKRSDLVTEEVNTINAAKGLSTILVTARIANRGGGTTHATSWYDAIYASDKANDFSNAKYIKSIVHSGALAVGESYSVKFEVQVPDVSQGKVFYYVKTDYNNYEDIESSEINNVKCSNEVLLVENLMNDNDYAALKCLYHATNGEGWKRPWNITSNAITTGRWNGVTFDNNGNVIEIDLHNNQLRGDLPSEGFTLASLKKLILHGNQLTGDIAPFLKGCTALTYLDLSDNRFTEMSEPLSTTIKDINLNNQHANGGRESLSVQSWKMEDPMKNIALTKIQSYSHAAQDFLACPDLNIYSRETETYLGSIDYVDNAYRLHLNGDYKLKNNAGILVRMADGVATGSYLRATLSFTLGDANADGYVSVLDAQQTLNRILGRQRGNFNYTAANTWVDDVINVQDIVKTINMFVNDNASMQSPALKNKPKKNYSGYLFAQTGEIMLNTTQRVAAMDITLQGVKASQIALRLPKSQFQMVTHDMKNGTRVVIFSPSGKEIPTGTTTILACSAPVEITRVESADVNAEPMHIGLNDATGLHEAISNKVEASVQNRQIQVVVPTEVSHVIVTLYDINGKQIMQRSCETINVHNVTLPLPTQLVGNAILEVKAEGFAPVVHKVVIK